jgi:hypothetical protein
MSRMAMKSRNAALEVAPARPASVTADHIFISYAWEDRVVADWLTLRLTAAGYRVWCDRFKMLGGERFPEHIDDAIKSRTFRMLGLLSRHSLHKPNPVNERTLALALARERNVDFYIPLDLEGIKPTDLPWMMSSITFIPFTDWFDGLSRTLKKLRSLDTPTPLADGGTQAVLDALMPLKVLREEPERLFSNCFRFSRLPEAIRLFAPKSFSGPVPDSISTMWPNHALDDGHVAAFAAPPVVHGLEFRDLDPVLWQGVPALNATPTRHIISNLLRQSLRLKLIQRGLREDKNSGLIYFPRAAGGDETKLVFVSPSGKNEDLQATGGRRFGEDVYRYHLAPTFRIRSDMGADFWAQLTVRVFITDKQETPLEPASAFVRRKHLTTNWYNHQWLTRQLAVMRYLSGGRGRISISIGSDASLIELDADPFSGLIPVGIDDRALAPLRDKASTVPDAIDDGLDAPDDDE